MIMFLSKEWGSCKLSARTEVECYCIFWSHFGISLIRKGIVPAVPDWQVDRTQKIIRRNIAATAPSFLSPSVFTQEGNRTGADRHGVNGALVATEKKLQFLYVGHLYL